MSFQLFVMSRTVIDHLQLGSISIRDVRSSIVPGMHQDEILLGMSVLKQLDFSQSGNELTIRQRM